MGRLCYLTQRRAVSWYFRQKTITVQGRYGTRFCSHGKIFIEHYECRVTKQVASRVFVSMQDANYGHESSVAVQIYNGTRNLSWCRNLIACRCGCPGISALQTCHGSRSKSKNRDNFPLHGTSRPV
jgi:hypothetical protein